VLPPLLGSTPMPRSPIMKSPARVPRTSCAAAGAAATATASAAANMVLVMIT
jgi:hypothetical protein